VSVPVLWVSRYTDKLSRGYFDEGFLEAVLAGKVWNPPGAFAFEHYVDVGRPGSTYPDAFPDVAGALVVLPARHHASPEDVSWFLAQLDRLSWSVVILAGDEEWSFPWTLVKRSPTRRVWVMQPRPEHAAIGVDGMLPGGWYPNTREGIAPCGVLGPRPLDWFFGGQITHERRQQAVKVLRSLDGPSRLIETAGYLQGVPMPEYLAFLSSAKVIPCPSGPCAVDTARPLEALEAGCVPVVDTVTPKGEDYDYWALCFGEDCPLPRIRDWTNFPAILQRELEGWPANANRLSAWWQQWKRSIVHRLHDDLRAVSGQPFVPTTPDEQVTVILTTSPVPLHPSMADLDTVISAIRHQLPEAEIVIAADGVRPEQEDARADYDEYVRRVCWLANFEWPNVVPFLADEWLGQAELTRRALKLVRTPLVFFVEHDRTPMGDIDWPGICGLVMSGKVNALRLHETPEVHPEHAHLMLEDHAVVWDGIPIRRTMAWWQHPHVIRTAVLRVFLEEYFDPAERTMIEDRLYQAAENDWFDNGPPAWNRWRLAIYSPPDMKRHRHLNSRGEATKWPNVGAEVPA
jgi:hypothetical protein